MNSISIGFSKPKNIKFPVYSWIIRAVCGWTEYSHVYVRIPTRHKVDLIYQASGTHLNFMGENHFKNKVEVVKEFSFDISDSAYDKFMYFAITKEGESYSLKQAVNILMHPILKRKVFQTENEYVCSVVGAMVIEDYIDEETINFIDVTLATPKDVYNMCELLLKSNQNG